MGGQWYDANIAIPGCDKNMPGCLISMGRLNRPAIMVSSCFVALRFAGVLCLRLVPYSRVVAHSPPVARSGSSSGERFNLKSLGASSD